MGSSAKHLLIWIFFALDGPTTCMANCNPRRLDLVEEGRTCQSSCAVNGDCRGPATCICDDNCGMSCVNTLRECSPVVSNPENGVVMMPRIRPMYGVRIWYGCRNGYHPSRRVGRTCRSDGRWSGVAPTCLQLCAAPEKPQNGYIVPARRNEWPLGSEATYFCDEGFTFVSASHAAQITRRCGPDGAWDSSLPECTARRPTNEGICPSPPGVSHGWYQLDNNEATEQVRLPSNTARDHWKADNVIIYRCKPGFDLVSGDLRRVCKWSGGWTGVQPRCVPSSGQPKDVYCASPPNVENGWVEIDRNFGDTDQPRPHIDPEDGNFGPTLVEIRWSPDDVILYRCNSRFELAGGSRRRTCTSDGTWTGTQPRCILKEPSSCPSPQQPMGGTVVPRGKAVWRTGDAYSVLCGDGYKSPSPNWSKCEQDGNWRPEVLRCIRIRLEFCSPPPAISNSWYRRLSGGFPVNSRWPEGSVVSYQCFLGYENKGDGRLICSTGKWSGEVASCVAESTCPAPVATNGVAIPIGRMTWVRGDTFSIRCSFGFVPPAPNLSTCRADGSWQPASLKCLASTRCKSPVAVHGTVVPREKTSWQPGDVFSIICSTGYRDPSPNLSICQRNGSWSPRELKCMSKTFCQSLTVRNGWVVSDRGQGGTNQLSVVSWSQGDVAIYRCKEGFRLVGGDERRICSGDGTWTGREPRCEAKSTRYCPSPAKIDDGFIENDRNAGQSSGTSLVQAGGLHKVHSNIVTRWVRGDVIRYRCKSGFQLKGGSERRVCAEGGKWTGTSPRCAKISAGSCPSPPRIENGFIENDRNQPMAGVAFSNSRIPRVRVRWMKGDVIRYKCKDGYRLHGGSLRRVCTSENVWTGTEPQCLREETSGDEGNWVRLSNGLYYTATTQRRSFSEVLADCSALGGIIAGSSIASDRILRELFEDFKVATFGRSYWIGLSDRQLEQDWKWLDGTRIDANDRWQRFHSNDILFGHDKDCAVVDGPSNKWRAENCTKSHLAICERGRFHNGNRNDEWLRVDHRSAALGGAMSSPTSDEEAFVVVPIKIHSNDTNEDFGSSEGPDVRNCEPNPCLNGCECEEFGLYGYLCQAMGPTQYLGSNCEYDPPMIECDHDAIEISISGDFIRGMDDGMGNGVAYLAPDEETARNLGAIREGCRFSPSDAADVYRVLIPFPFDSCGTYAISKEGEISFGNLIWYNRELAADLDISVHSSVAEVSCTYEDFYRVTSVIDSICCPTPPIVTSNGVFMFETTVWADPPEIADLNTPLSGRNRTRADVNENGYISYRVGEMLYLTVKMKSRHGASPSLVPALTRCWMSPEVTSHNPRLDRDLILHPRSDPNVNTYGPVVSGLEVHFGFQLMRAKRSAIVYLHCQIKVVSKRVTRSLKNDNNDSDEVSILTKGPIVFLSPPPRRIPVTNEIAEGGIDFDEATNRLILGISFFGVAAIALTFGCCVAHLRTISARGHRQYLQGSGLHRARAPSLNRHSANFIHPLM